MNGGEAKLEINEDFRFSKREWAFERCGWVFLFLIILLAAAGVFGSGPLSRAKAETPDGAVTAEYARTVRRESPSLVQIRFSGTEQARSLAVSSELLAAWQIESITPEPEEAAVEGSQIVYQFNGRGAGTVRIVYLPKNIGLLEGAFHLPAGERLAIRQFTFP